MLGIALLCIGVGVLYPRDSQALNSAGVNPSSEKFISFLLQLVDGEKVTRAFCAIDERKTRVPYSTTSMRRPVVSGAK
jgi:hypothetical protein